MHHYSSCALVGNSASLLQYQVRSHQHVKFFSCLGVSQGSRTPVDRAELAGIQACRAGRRSVAGT